MTEKDWIYGECDGIKSRISTDGMKLEILYGYVEKDTNSFSITLPISEYNHKPKLKDFCEKQKGLERDISNHIQDNFEDLL